MEGLRIMSRYGIELKKNRFFYFNVPLSASFMITIIQIILDFIFKNQLFLYVTIIKRGIKYYIMLKYISCYSTVVEINTFYLSPCDHYNSIGQMNEWNTYIDAPGCESLNWAYFQCDATINSYVTHG